MSDKDILTYGYLKEASKNANFLSRLEAAVKEIDEELGSLSMACYGSFVETKAFERGVREAQDMALFHIRHAFPELKNVQRPESES